MNDDKILIAKECAVIILLFLKEIEELKALIRDARKMHVPSNRYEWLEKANKLVPEE